MRGMTRIIGVSAACGALLLALATAGQAKRYPSLSWSPSTSGGFDYGLLGVGHTASQTFTLTNSGGSASAALEITLSGPAAFTITEDTCSETSLGPDKSCAVTVEYAPTASGASGPATLNATGKKEAATADLTLAGSAALEFHANGPAVPGLSGLNENPQHPESSATGTTVVFWDTSTSTMTVKVVFNGLTTPNTAAHIHCCVAPPGTAGVSTTVPTFTGFPSGVTSGTYTHTFNMLDSLSWNPAFITTHGGTAASAGLPCLAGLQAGQRVHEHPHPDVRRRRGPRLPAAGVSCREDGEAIAGAGLVPAPALRRGRSTLA